MALGATTRILGLAQPADKASEYVVPRELSGERVQ